MQWRCWVRVLQLLLFLVVGTRWSWVVSVTPQPHFKLGNRPSVVCSLERRLGGLQSRSVSRGYRIETQSFNPCYRRSYFECRPTNWISLWNRTSAQKSCLFSFMFSAKNRTRYSYNASGQSISLETSFKLPNQFVKLLLAENVITDYTRYSFVPYITGLTAIDDISFNFIYDYLNPK